MKKNYGILLIILGNLLYLSYIFFGNKISSSFSEFSSGVLLGLSIGTNLVGIIITSKNIAENSKNSYMLIRGIMKYIVLLRWINISGKNKISMEELKKYLIENEYQSVYTYLNSGNIILESNESNKENIVKNIHNLIKKNLI